MQTTQTILFDRGNDYFGSVAFIYIQEPLNLLLNFKWMFILKWKTWKKLKIFKINVFCYINNAVQSTQKWHTWLMWFNSILTLWQSLLENSITFQFYEVKMSWFMLNWKNGRRKSEITGLFTIIFKNTISQHWHSVQFFVAKFIHHTFKCLHK